MAGGLCACHGCQIRRLLLHLCYTHCVSSAALPLAGFAALPVSLAAAIAKRDDANRTRLAGLPLSSVDDSVLELAHTAILSSTAETSSRCAGELSSPSSRSSKPRCPGRSSSSTATLRAGRPSSPAARTGPASSARAHRPPSARRAS
eukprot:140534-Prymnesium_polylepis.1